MSYTAIFIGGAFDMTKRDVESREVEQFFYEPVTRLRPYLSRIPPRRINPVPYLSVCTNSRNTARRFSLRIQRRTR